MPTPEQTAVDALLRQAPADRVPYDLTAESALLGVLLWDRGALPAVAPLLSPDAFFETAHATIYGAMAELAGRGAAVELVTVSAELHRRGQLAPLGGEGTLQSLILNRGDPAQAAHYAAVVARHYVFRRLLTVGGQIAGLGYRQDANPEAVLAEAAGLLSALLTQRAAPARRMIDVVDSVLTALQERQAGGAGSIPTGFPTLDQHVYGWEPGQLIVLAALPTFGKTALAQQFADAAARAGHAVAVLSLEMEPEELARRHLARTASVDLGILRRATAGPGDWTKLSGAMETLDLPIHFLDLYQPSVEQLELAVQRLQADPAWGCDLLIVDYLQLMPGRGGTREQEVAAVSRGLKRLARRCHIPVIALSQFSRAAHEHPVPVLQDLRESGALEQDANIVLALARPDLADKRRVDLHVLKQRDGEADLILPLRWHGGTQTFAEVTERSWHG